MKKLLFTAILGVVLVSCSNETSLQEYFVENQNDRRFMALDVPSSLLVGENSSLDAEQRETLKTIKKVNLLGYPMNEENKATYEEEKAKIKDILNAEKYQSLMRYGGGGTRSAQLYYLGEEDAIDEFIIFGADSARGFGVARVLGDDMQVDALMKLVSSFEKGDINIQGLEEIISLKK